MSLWLDIQNILLSAISHLILFISIYKIAGLPGIVLAETGESGTPSGSGPQRWDCPGRRAGCCSGPGCLHPRVYCASLDCLHPVANLPGASLQFTKLDLSRLLSIKHHTRLGQERRTLLLIVCIFCVSVSVCVTDYLSVVKFFVTLIYISD